MKNRNNIENMGLSEKYFIPDLDTTYFIYYKIVYENEHHITDNTPDRLKNVW